MGPQSVDADPAQTPSVVVAIAATLAIAAVAGWWFGWPISLGASAGWFSDAIDYLLLADHFRAAHDLPTASWAAALATNTRFPPAFPAVLAVVGAGTQNQQLALVVTAASAVAATISGMVWLRARTGSIAVATTLILPFLLSPAFFVIQLDVVSEPLFIAVFYAALLLLARPESRRSTTIAALALLALLPLIRLAGIAAIAGFAAWTLCRRDLALPVRATRVLVVCVPVALWLAVRAWLGSSDSYLDYLADDPMRAAQGGPIDFASHQLQSMAGGLARLFALTLSPLAITVAALLALIAVVGWLMRLRRNDLDAWVLPAYVAMVFLWPFPAESARLLVPILPLLLLCAWHAIAAASGPSRTVLGAASISVLLLAAEASSITRIVERLHAVVEPELEPFKTAPAYLVVDDNDWALQTLKLNAQLSGAAGALANYVATTDCVYSTIPAFVRLRSGNVRTLATPLDLISEDDARQRLSRCRYVLLTNSTSPQYQQAFLYPETLLHAFAKPVFISSFEFKGKSGTTVVLVELDRTPK